MPRGRRQWSRGPGFRPAAGCSTRRTAFIRRPFRGVDPPRRARPRPHGAPQPGRPGAVPRPEPDDVPLLPAVLRPVAATLPPVACTHAHPGRLKEGAPPVGGRAGLPGAGEGAHRRAAGEDPELGSLGERLAGAAARPSRRRRLALHARRADRQVRRSGRRRRPSCARGGTRRRYPSDSVPDRVSRRGTRSSGRGAGTATAPRRARAARRRARSRAGPIRRGPCAPRSGCRSP